VEEHPEYKLVVQSNRLSVDIDNELAVVHKVRACPPARPAHTDAWLTCAHGRCPPQFTRDHYAPKFPELESLVLVPLDYMRVVKAIGNETVCAPPSLSLSLCLCAVGSRGGQPAKGRLCARAQDLTKVDLAAMLPATTVMVITVTATTTSGKPLPPDELAKVGDACDMAIQLDECKKKVRVRVSTGTTARRGVCGDERVVAWVVRHRRRGGVRRAHSCCTMWRRACRSSRPT
jgi:U4/U6 small nuclear ribonucleoprotein PRP31